MSIGPLHDELAALQEPARKAYAAHKAAKYDLERNTWRAAREATRPLVKFRDDIVFRRPNAVPEDQRPKRAHELTREFCDALLERGLIVEAAGNGGGVNILDPQIDMAFFDTNKVAVKAREAVKAFEEQNADGLEAERKAADAAKIREALDSGDGNRIREALGVRG